ncbi:MAG: sulfatase-like hydrolase/transferase [Thermoanaerobaculia bacterium]|nr:sulfatase-like hydrolase/transferase [Thermoanaerobaculia bacterium]
MHRTTLPIGLVALLAATACGTPATEAPPKRPALLLVTLDTTRADHVAPEAPADHTPTLAGLAARGVSFAHAYTTVPVTLPAHTSMLTGLYPGGHGIHENGRRVPESLPLLAPRLAALGYQTAAVVSGAPLDSAYGLARGFTTYDDDFGPGGSERPAGPTTDRALAVLANLGSPAFLWVHYFDAHEPYEPPKQFLEKFPGDPYRAEIAYFDHELARLIAAFEGQYPEARLLIVGDHGEGRGEHGEDFHGNLLYQATMRVPLLVVAPGGESARRIEAPVSTRAVYDTLLGWASGESAPGLLAAGPDLVLGEAMKPYLDYGWQPQWMAVRGVRKVIQAGAVDTEIFDLVADPGETDNLAARGASLEREVRQALAEYPLPTPGGAPLSTDDPVARAQLASLGYLVSEGPRPLRADAPVPRKMARLLTELTVVSELFSAGRYAEAAPRFERILAADPGNFSAALRLAVALGALGRDDEARRAFERARQIAPESLDLRHYRGLYALHRGDFAAAARDLEAVLAASPTRLATLTGLAEVHRRRGEAAASERLWRRALELEPDHLPALVALGELAMAQGDTAGALAGFERAREIAGAGFEHHLELGVLYLAARRLTEAAASLDAVPPGHPGYAMALFKRAQVAVLAGEPDAAEAIARARAGADDTTRELIAREKLFAP